MVDACLVGDGRGERAGVAGPHAFGVVAERRRAVHEVEEVGELGCAPYGSQVVRMCSERVENALSWGLR